MLVEDVFADLEHFICIIFFTACIDKVVTLIIAALGSSLAERFSRRCGRFGVLAIGDSMALLATLNTHACTATRRPCTAVSEVFRSVRSRV